MGGSTQANNFWGNYTRTSTNGTGCNVNRHKAATWARFLVESSTHGYDWYECSTLSGRCIGIFGTTSSQDHFITNGDQGRYAEINMGSGVDIWFNHTKHMLVTPDAIWVRYLVPS
jgi:hypothetical protein